jgi:nucleotide-binding universal stress UspA family protein
MFKHILVPVDGSPTSDLAIDKAVAMAKAFGSVVTAICVIDPYPFTSVGTDYVYGETQYLSTATAEANEAVKGAREAFEAAGIPVKVQVVEGHAVYKGILTTAESVGADLIVIGSHGRRGIEKWVLGSVAQRVLSHAHVPVLVVRR